MSVLGQGCREGQCAGGVPRAAVTGPKKLEGGNRYGRSLGINTLMVIAVVGAVLIGKWAEAADVVLMGDDLAQLPFIVWLSRKTNRIVVANIAFALAAAGLATLWMAIVADVGASLAVILNGLRLRRI